MLTSEFISLEPRQKEQPRPRFSGYKAARCHLEKCLTRGDAALKSLVFVLPASSRKDIEVSLSGVTCNRSTTKRMVALESISQVPKYP